MGKLTNLNPSKALTEADMPATAAMDAEVAAAINAHVNAADPHPVYLTSSEGDTRYVRAITTTFTVDLPNLAPNGLDKRFYTLVGAKVGDAALLMPINVNLFATAAWPFLFAAVVESADTIGCYFRNDNPGAIDLSSIQFRIVVLQF